MKKTIMKKTLTLLLALVMCVGLAVPALAAPVPALLDADVIETTNADAPQYAVYQVPMKLYIGLGTYVKIAFSISDKDGSYHFESVDHISFGNLDPSTYYYEVISHSYQLNDKVCVLDVVCDEMYKGALTGIRESYTLTLLVEEVMGSPRNGDPVMLSPESVSVSYDMEATKQSTVYEFDDGTKLMISSWVSGVEVIY